MPATFCISRQLDRCNAVTDVIRHFDTLEKYYKDAKTPRKTVEDRETSDCESFSNESEESNIDKDVQEAKKVSAGFKKNLRA